MCLITVNQCGPYRADLYRTGTGWKVYYKNNGEFEALFRRGRGPDVNAEPGKGKIESEDWMGIERGYKQYTAGFHVYVNRADAEHTANQCNVLNYNGSRVVCHGVDFVP